MGFVDLLTVVVDFLFIVTLIAGVCNCFMFCCTLLYVHSSSAIILIGKRELVALLNLSSWCLVMFERLFLMVPLGCLQFVIVVFPDHTHLLFLGGWVVCVGLGICVYLYIKSDFSAYFFRSDFDLMFYGYIFYFGSNWVNTTYNGHVRPLKTQNSLCIRTV